MNSLDAAVLTIGLSLTAVLTYGALSLYVAANRPGDRPTWADFFEFVAGVAGAVLGAFHLRSDGERKA